LKRCCPRTFTNRYFLCFTWALVDKVYILRKDIEIGKREGDDYDPE